MKREDAGVEVLGIGETPGPGDRTDETQAGNVHLGNEALGINNGLGAVR